jgi:hypothetical protein
MNIIFIILLVLAALVALFLIIALIAKKDYSISREITINKPRSAVFDYLKYIRNQDNYSKWVMMDPNVKKDFSGTDGTPGFVYAWEGTKAGKGEQEIKNIKDGERIDLELRFKKPFEGVASTYIKTDSLSDKQTTVRWVMEGTNPYPRNAMNLIIGKLLGKDLETTLVNLQSILEKK